MNILLIGSGGREHALAWAMSASPMVDKLYCAPGNPGIDQVARVVDLKLADHGGIVRFCKDNAIGLVVVGPEAPLVAGLADDLRESGIKVFGPSKFAAQLEGSKGFTKDICTRYGIPTAAYGRFKDKAAALAYLDAHGAPIVVKADGLAAGKGVTVAMTIGEARTAIEEIFSGTLRRRRMRDRGISRGRGGELLRAVATAAMPCRSPPRRITSGWAMATRAQIPAAWGPIPQRPCMTEALCAEALERIVKPTIRALKDMGHPYVGVLYAGLILTRDGPKLIEYNVRFGDPEMSGADAAAQGRSGDADARLR